MDLQPYLAGFAAAYAILVVAASSPGPAVAMLLGIGLGQGRRAALIATLGIACAGIMLNLLTLVGVGLIVAQVAWAMTVLRLLGAAYLLWLAWNAFKKARNPAPLHTREVPVHSFWQSFSMGFLLQATNPKAIVFWLAIAAVGATQGGGFPVIVAFVAGAFIISFSCHGAWALLLSSKPVREGYARVQRPVEALLGTFFTYAAFRLATDRGSS